MIPLRDNVDAKRLPVVTWVLIGINVVIFFLMIGLPQDAQQQLIFTFGVIPQNLPLDEPLNLLQQPVDLFSLISSQFLHANWFHLLSNMWILFIFGDNVEDLMGKWRYLLFYLFAGIVANLAHAISIPDAQIPAVGASGAIAGVLGAYLILFPQARILTVIFIFIIPWFIQIPAVIFLGIWFIMQISQGLIDIDQSVGGVAWWAHIGGFIFGLALVHLFVRRKRLSERN